MKSPTMLVRRQRLGARGYQLTDRLHDGAGAGGELDGIAITLSAWLAELGARSTVIGGLRAEAVRSGDSDDRARPRTERLS